MKKKSLFIVFSIILCLALMNIKVFGAVMDWNYTASYNNTNMTVTDVREPGTFGSTSSTSSNNYSYKHKITVEFDKVVSGNFDLYFSVNVARSDSFLCWNCKLVSVTDNRVRFSINGEQNAYIEYYSQNTSTYLSNVSNLCSISPANNNSEIGVLKLLDSKLGNIDLKLADVLGELVDYHTEVEAFISEFLSWDDPNGVLGNIKSQLSSIQNTLTSMNNTLINIDSLIDTISWNNLGINFLGYTSDLSTYDLTSGTKNSGGYFGFSSYNFNNLSNSLIKIRLQIQGAYNNQFKVFYKPYGSTNLTDISSNVIYELLGRNTVEFYIQNTNMLQPYGSGNILVQVLQNTAIYDISNDKNNINYLLNNDIEYWNLISFMNQNMLLRQILEKIPGSSETAYDSRIYPLLNDGNTDSRIEIAAFEVKMNALLLKENAINTQIDSFEANYLTDIDDFKDAMTSDLTLFDTSLGSTAMWLKSEMENIYADLGEMRFILSTPINLALLGSIIGIRKRSDEE